MKEQDYSKESETPPKKEAETTKTIIGTDEDEPEQARKTPLYERHLDAGGKMVDFHGWFLPIQYKSIIEEHDGVRTKAALFDVSHMGEIEVSGPDSPDFLQRLLTNDIRVKAGRAVYSPMCYPSGGTVDDLIVYRKSDESYFLVVNASNTEKDYKWLLENKNGRVDIRDLSDEYCLLACQGPQAHLAMKRLLRDKWEDLRFFSYSWSVTIDGMKVMMSRTGYTGEDGFELYCSPEDAVRLWDMILDAGKEYGIIPAGLGARDTLRLEAALPLYGQELSRDISPVMAGLKRFIKPGKGEFTGRKEIVKQIERGTEYKIAGFDMIDRGIPRSDYDVYCNGAKVGYVTSGGYFPTLKRNMGLALLRAECTEAGRRIEIEIRGKRCAAGIVGLPFYKR